MAAGEGNKLWGGRFTGETDPVMEKFNASISYDQRMSEADIQGSQAYVKAIEKVGLVTAEERQAISNGLDKIQEEWTSGAFQLKPGDEDIHTANERRLKELIGGAAGKLHTGRSRNDQVATDTRLWLRQALGVLMGHLKDLITVFVNRAREDRHIDARIHTFAKSPANKMEPLVDERDLQRLKELFARVDLCPLGCGALAGNPFNVDRTFLATELGFSGVTGNSLDGTSDRDFIIEFLFVCSMIGIHLSKWAEDLVIYSTKEFSFVSLSDAYSTGSSLMPQKKNADSLELIRGKAGRMSGHLMGLMMTVKGLPSTYNKDLQEDKEAMFDVYDTLTGVLQVSTGTLSTLKVNVEACQNALSADMLATDLAYYLVRKGVPFREAHGLSGNCVALAEEKQCPLSKLSVADLRIISNKFDDDVLLVWNYENSVEQYQSDGGTSRSSVLKQVEQISTWLKSLK